MAEASTDSSAVKTEKRRLRQYPNSESQRLGLSSQLDSLQSTIENMNQQISMLQDRPSKDYRECSDEDMKVESDEDQYRARAPSKTKRSSKPPTPDFSLEAFTNYDDSQLGLPKKQQSLGAKFHQVKRVCLYCHTTTTPMWRRGPAGKSTLCNRCGVKWRSGRELVNPDGSILPPPSPTSNSRPTKTSKQHSKTKSCDQDSIDRETYAQKRHLANMLSLDLLPQHHLAHVVTLIRASMPTIGEMEEIEVDFESMNAGLVRELYDYVTSVAGLKSNEDDLTLLPNPNDAFVGVLEL